MIPKDAAQKWVAMRPGVHYITVQYKAEREPLIHKQWSRNDALDCYHYCIRLCKRRGSGRVWLTKDGNRIAEWP